MRRRPASPARNGPATGFAAIGQRDRLVGAAPGCEVAKELWPDRVPVLGHTK